MQSCCAHSDEVTPVIRPYDRCQAYICHTVQAPGSIGMPGRRSVTPGIRALCPVSQLMVSIKIILCSFWIYLASSAALCDGWPTVTKPQSGCPIRLSHSKNKIMVKFLCLGPPLLEDYYSADRACPFDPSIAYFPTARPRALWCFCMGALAHTSDPLRSICQPSSRAMADTAPFAIMASL